MEATLGEKLRKLRRDNGLTLADLSTRTDLPERTLGRIENGQTKNLRLDTWVKLERGLASIGIPEATLSEMRPPTSSGRLARLLGGPRHFYERYGALFKEQLEQLDRMTDQEIARMQELQENA